MLLLVDGQPLRLRLLVMLVLRGEDGAEAVGQVEHATGLGAVDLADLVGSGLRRV